MNNKLLTVLVVVAIALGGYAALSGGTVIEKTAPSNIGAVGSPDVYSYLNVYGAFMQGGGIATVETANATTTFTTAQLQAHILDINPTTLALTATLPASSSFPFINNAGDHRQWILRSNSATSTTLAAGTGVDLQEVEGGDVVLETLNYIMLDCYRLTDLSVSCLAIETIPAD